MEVKAEISIENAGPGAAEGFFASITVLRDGLPIPQSSTNASGPMALGSARRIHFRPIHLPIIELTQGEKEAYRIDVRVDGGSETRGVVAESNEGNNVCRFQFIAAG
jgi:hypothetical protein